MQAASRSTLPNGVRSSGCNSVPASIERSENQRADRDRREKLAQGESAKLLGVAQPRISDLMRGKIDLFSVESLIDMLSRSGLEVEVRLRKAA